MKMKSIQIAPLHLFIFTFLVAMALHLLYQWRVSWYLTLEVVQVLGIFLLLIAFLINLLAYKKFKSHKTSDKPFSRPKKLICDGVFHFSRNPVYIALIVSQLALAFIFDTLYFFITSFFLWLSLHVYIVANEERVLLEEFGDDYEKYTQQTPRWL